MPCNFLASFLMLLSATVLVVGFALLVLVFWVLPCSSLECFSLLLSATMLAARFVILVLVFWFCLWSHGLYLLVSIPNTYHNYNLIDLEQSWSLENMASFILLWAI